MGFEQTLEYMYALLPMYQRVGKVAFKKDLTNTIELCKFLNNPEKKFKSIHIAGTNGKGSSAHMLASVLQTAGYKVGLYTSPHLKSFTERIKINGKEIEEHDVTNFIENISNQIKKIHPSFFEVTVAMAFDYFANNHVDIAVIEVGLGGRFDSTNVITPIVSLITSIGLDHTDMLGETIPEIAFEKAGIIKSDVPVVISETQEQTTKVFRQKASDVGAPIYFVDKEYEIIIRGNAHSYLDFTASSKNNSLQLSTDLAGEYQVKNIPGVLKVIDLLKGQEFQLTEEHIRQGLKHTVKNTGLLGRWQKLYDNPTTICDTVHNVAGVKYLVKQLESISYGRLYIIWGAVEGKPLEEIFDLLPKKAHYYFSEPSVPRALKAAILQQEASNFGVEGLVVKDVNKAIELARKKAQKNDLIIIAGSNFLIADINDI